MTSTSSSSGARVTVGVIGLGPMGLPIAGHLVEAGHDVTVFNRTRSVAEGVAGRSASSMSCRARANWPMICCATSCSMPAARPYCATAPVSVRSVSTLTRVPVAIGSSAKRTLAAALPRPL